MPAFMPSSNHPFPPTLLPRHRSPASLQSIITQFDSKALLLITKLSFINTNIRIIFIFSMMMMMLSLEEKHAQGNDADKENDDDYENNDNGEHDVAYG